VPKAPREREIEKIHTHQSSAVLWRGFMFRMQ